MSQIILSSSKDVFPTQINKSDSSGIMHMFTREYFYLMSIQMLISYMLIETDVSFFSSSSPLDLFTMYCRFIDVTTLELDSPGAVYDDTIGILEKGGDSLKWGEVFQMFKR